jgi:hypothetical protein
MHVETVCAVVQIAVFLSLYGVIVDFQTLHFISCSEV